MRRMGNPAADLIHFLDSSNTTGCNLTVEVWQVS